MSSRWRQMNCVWTVGRLIWGAATPLIYSSISHWSSPSDTGYQIHLHPLRNEESETDGICIQTPWLYSHSIFPVVLLPFFSPHVVAPQSCGCNALTLPPSSPPPPPSSSLFTPASRLACLLPRCASFSHSISGGVLVSDGVLVDPASDPVVGFFSATHHRQSISPLHTPGLCLGRAPDPDFLLFNLAWNMHGLTPVSLCLLTCSRPRLCSDYITFLSAPGHGIS